MLLYQQIVTYRGTKDLTAPLYGLISHRGYRYGDGHVPKFTANCRYYKGI